ncbi:MAG: hypothetical protein BAJALOKI1v1_600010 [Promethearchaeota archaeon]|nr:MAG: hypothetical protein BAJALOKI1v1_600010 [Candidatus Lokiarchaeota archaeon]
MRVKILWEWRIFFKKLQPNAVQLSESCIALLSKSPLETRTDYYYNLTRAKFGLKERGTSAKNKVRLELKVLHQQKEWGAQLWSKPIKSDYLELPTEHIGLPPTQIIEILTSYSSSSIKKDIINEITTIFKENTPKRMKIEKARLQTELKSVEIEQTEISINSQQFFTICIESSHAQNISKFIRNHIQYNSAEVFPGSYPEFIITMGSS